MNDVKEKVKFAGWIAAAVAFVALALSSLECSYMPQLSGLSLMVAGAALFWSERAKSAIFIAIMGLALLISPGMDQFCRNAVRILVYISVLFYFKRTRIFRIVIIDVAILSFLQLFHEKHIWSGHERWPIVVASLLAVFQLFLAVCFMSRKYLLIEEKILEYKEKLGVLVVGLLKHIRSIYDRVLEKARARSAARAKKLSQESGFLQKFCKTYAYSVFVLGLISAAVFVFWASPVEKRGPWNPHLVTMAVSQVVVCALWGCFILSQIACAIKLRGRQIVAGSAPMHLLIVSFLCWILIVAAIIGIVYLFVGRLSKGEMSSDWGLSLTLTLIDVPTLLGVAQRCDLKAAITLSSIVTIWHLLGSSFVALLMRDNIAKVRSLGNESDPATAPEP
jgi:hypothetical protein